MGGYISLCLFKNAYKNTKIDYYGAYNIIQWWYFSIREIDF